jgi:hypothetical protein
VRIEHRRTSRPRGLRAVAGALIVAAGATACSATSSSTSNNTTTTPAYVYPRDDMSAAPSPRVLRVRIGQHGFDSLIKALPDMFIASCGPDSTTCALDNPDAPTKVRLYLGTPDKPLTFSVIGFDGKIRSGDNGVDYYYRSSVGLDLKELASNLKVNFATDSSGSAIFLTIENMHLSADMVIYFGSDYACYVHDGSQSAFEVSSLSLTVRPHIVSDEAGRPMLVLKNTDVEIGNLDVSLAGAQIVPAMGPPPIPEDPACTSTCGSCVGFANLTGFLSGLLGTAIGQELGVMLASTLVGQLGADGMPLEASGEQLPIGALVPGVSRFAMPIAYLVAANTGSPTVTGAMGSLGMNLDMDLGLAVRHSPAVPLIDAPIWEYPTPPDPGGSVAIVNPATGATEQALFGAAVMLSDVVVNRALFGLFDSGSLCFDFKSETIAAMTGGSFAPTVQALSTFAPGLASIGPGTSPVDIAMMPRTPPVIRFGTGAGTGPTRDSHIKLTWLGTQIDFYPWLEEGKARAYGMSFDLFANVSIEPMVDGTFQLVVDKLDLVNLAETYNELGISFDLDGFSDLFKTFLPLLVTGKPIQPDLGLSPLASAVFPKVQTAQLLGFEGNYLGIFLDVCTGAEKLDPSNWICYSPSRARLQH